MESLIITAGDDFEKDGDRGMHEKYAGAFIDTSKDSIANIRENLIRGFSCEQRRRQLSWKQLKKPTLIKTHEEFLAEKD